MSNLKLAGLFFGVFVVGVVLFTFIFIVFSITPQQYVVENEEVNDEQNDTNEIASEEIIHNSVAQEDVPKIEFIKCNTIGCFLELASTCTSGEIDKVDVPFPLFPMATFVDGTYFRIDGRNENNKCVFIQESREGYLEVSEESRQELKLAEGLTEEELDAAIENVVSFSDNINERKARTVCTGEGEDIATYIENLLKGSGSISCKINLVLEGEPVPPTECTAEPNLSCLSTEILE